MKKLWKNIQTEDVCFIVLGTSFTKDPYTLLGKYLKCLFVLIKNLGARK